jgi:hypothetical protein
MNCATHWRTRGNTSAAVRRSWTDGKNQQAATSGTLQRLKADVARASNDVDVLTNALWAAEHAAEAFECCAP